MLMQFGIEIWWLWHPGVRLNHLGEGLAGFLIQPEI